MKKRVLSSVLAVTMAATALTACGGSQKPAETAAQTEAAEAEHEQATEDGASEKKKHRRRPYHHRRRKGNSGEGGQSAQG